MPILKLVYLPLFRFQLPTFSSQWVQGQFAPFLDLSFMSVEPFFDISIVLWEEKCECSDCFFDQVYGQDVA